MLLLINFYLFVIELKQSNFDPYSTSIIGVSNSSNDTKKVVGNLPQWDKLLEEEKRKRLEIINNSKVCTREVKIYKLDYFNINEVIKSIDKEEETKEVKEQDNYAQAMSILKVSRDDQFKIKSRIEFEKLVKEKLYTKGLIQFKFTNNIVLLAYFALQESMNDVYDFFKSLLDLDTMNSKQISFTLTYDHPPKIISRSNKTVYQEKLFPNTIVFVNFYLPDGKIVEPPFNNNCMNYLQLSNNEIPINNKNN